MLKEFSYKGHWCVVYEGATYVSFSIYRHKGTGGLLTVMASNFIGTLDEGIAAVKDHIDGC